MTQTTLARPTWRNQYTLEEMREHPITGEATKLLVNRPPAITWHRLKINETELALDAIKVPEAAVAEIKRSGTIIERTGILLPDELFFSEKALSQVQDLNQSCEVAERASSVEVVGSAIPGSTDFTEHTAATPANSAPLPPRSAHEVEFGMGPEATAWLDAAAQISKTWVCAGQASIEVYLNAMDSASSVVSLAVVALDESKVSLRVHADSPEGGSGVVGVQLRLIAHPQAQIQVETLQTLDDGYTYIENIATQVFEQSRIALDQTVLGSHATYTGAAANLADDQAQVEMNTHYLGRDDMVLDFNYIIRQRGTNTTSLLLANGVLADSAQKTLRGTIDLINGCGGSAGREQETVLIASETARNKTLPVILCNEDDVAGDHGATIGHVNPEQLEYLQSRGLSTEQAEKLFIGAQFDYAYECSSTERARAAIDRLALRVIGRHAGAEEGEE